MVSINKEEKMAIAERFPGVHIVRTMRQRSKRHRYYCEESKPVMRFLGQMRGTEPKQTGPVPLFSIRH